MVLGAIRPLELTCYTTPESAMETARPYPKPYSPLLAECLKTLREREADLHARGILHAGVFGSVARGEERENSDIDVVVATCNRKGSGLQSAHFADGINCD